MGIDQLHHEDGSDLDGQGTTELRNLKSVDMSEGHIGDDGKLYFGTSDDVGVYFDSDVGQIGTLRFTHKDGRTIGLDLEDSGGGIDGLPRLKMDGEDFLAIAPRGPDQAAIQLPGGFDGNTSFLGNRIDDAGSIRLNPQDVRDISSPVEGEYADHDGSGSNVEGLARYNGAEWVSQVDNSTIS